MIKKRDFIVLLFFLIGLFFVTSIIAETSVEIDDEIHDHSFGPSLNLSKYSTNSLILVSIIGLVITMISAVLLERNISKVASKSGATVGTVLMGLASSIPLLVIVVTLALENRGDLVLTNIISANIANLTLVLGILSFFKPLNRGKSFQRGVLGLFILLLSVAALFFFVSADLEIVRDSSFTVTKSTGFVLLGLFLFFILFLNFFKNKKEHHLESKNLKKEIFSVLFFGLLVAWFASVTVKAFILIAESYSVPTIIIGSVIGVIGASLPELAIGLVCLIKKDHEAVFSNLVTSNIVNFNVGLGLAVLILGTIVIDKVNVLFKIPFMLFVMFVATVFFMKKKRKKKDFEMVVGQKLHDLGITRFEGFILLLLFCAWIISLLVFF